MRIGMTWERGRSLGEKGGEGRRVAVSGETRVEDVEGRWWIG